MLRPEKQMILALMEQEGINKSELARRLGKYSSTVCDTLGPNGHRSMLVSDLSEYAAALGYELQIIATKGDCTWHL